MKLNVEYICTHPRLATGHSSPHHKRAGGAEAGRGRRFGPPTHHSVEKHPKATPRDTEFEVIEPCAAD